MMFKTFDEMTAEQRLAYKIGYDTARRDLLANGERVEWCETHGDRYAKELETMASGYSNHCMYACHHMVDGCRFVLKLLVDSPTEED